MSDSVLIVRIVRPSELGRAMAVPPVAGQVAKRRLGEQVVFACSEIPGVWTCIGLGRLENVINGENGPILTFVEVVRFASAVSNVTTGDPAFDAAEIPYVFDELSAGRLAEVLERSASVEGAREEALPYFVGSRAESMRAIQHAPWLSRALIPTTELYAITLRSYDETCALTGLRLRRSKDRREGFVIPIHINSAADPIVVSDVMPVTGTMAFYYAEGLIAITESFELWLHPLLDTQIGVLLRELNPDLRLHLPLAPQDWPALELLRLQLRDAQFQAL